MLKAGLYLNHMELAKMVADKSNEVVQWTIKYLGVKYKGLVHLGGHSVPRSYSTYNRSGSAIVNQQLAKLKEFGVKVKTESYLVNLITDKNGGVKGVKIRDGYRFSNENSGTVKYIKAKKAVVMATGGFSNDIAFRNIQDPKLTADVDSTNQPGATAEALLEALNIGATPVQPSWIQLGPWTSPDEKGFGIAPHFTAGMVFQYGVMVDPATGKRFVNELADRKTRADAIIKTNHPAIGIADDNSAKGRERLTAKLIKRGIVKQFNTLEDLAAEYKIPFKALKETVKSYNTYLKNGEDKEFGRYLQKDAKPIGKNPLYAIRIWPKVHHTMGGVQINTNAQVIGLDHEPIRGLYAAGEVAGGVHGAVRLGSCAVVDCLVFGRIAGKNAAAEKSWS
jgi:flavocytochrome c